MLSVVSINVHLNHTAADISPLTPEMQPTVPICLALDLGFISADACFFVNWSETCECNYLQVVYGKKHEFDNAAAYEEQVHSVLRNVVVHLTS